MDTPHYFAVLIDQAGEALITMPTPGEDYGWIACIAPSDYREGRCGNTVKFSPIASVNEESLASKGHHADAVCPSCGAAYAVERRMLKN